MFFNLVVARNKEGIFHKFTVINTGLFSALIVRIQ